MNDGLILNLGGLEIDMTEITAEYEKHPVTEQIWQQPDRIADFVAQLANTTSEKKRDELMEMIEPVAVLMALPTQRTTWRHLNLGGVSPAARLYSLIMLHDERAHLRQDDYNFLCGVDIPDARLSISKAEDAAEAINNSPFPPRDAQEFYRQKALEDMTIDPQQKRLGEAFVRMMVQEAEPHLARMIGGAFVMERVPLPFLDNLVTYESLRLVIQPGGIRGSLVYGDMYSPFFWSPRRTSLWMKGAKLAWALQVVCASIWRDACVVKHEFVTERRRSTYQPRPRQSREQKAITVLPRVIRHVVWSSDEERERIIRQAHAVRQHYRELVEGWQASNEARANAVFYGWPEPPEGWTFVKPHTRGGTPDSEVSPARQVICKGLQIAKIALG